MTRVTNHKLEVVKQNGWKKEEIIEEQKVEAIVVKWHKARRGISFSSEKKDESNLRNEVNLDQANNKYL